MISYVEVNRAMMKLLSVLTKHVEKVMIGQPTDVGVRRNLINVRRNHVFEDGIAKID